MHHALAPLLTVLAAAVLLLVPAHASPVDYTPPPKFHLQLKALNGDKAAYDKLWLDLVTTGPESSFVGGFKSPKYAYDWQYNATERTLTTEEFPNGGFPESLALLHNHLQNVTGIPKGYYGISFQLGLETPGFEKPGPFGSALVFKNKKMPKFAAFAICHLKYNYGFAQHGHGPTLLWRTVGTKPNSTCSDVQLIKEPPKQ